MCSLVCVVLVGAVVLAGSRLASAATPDPHAAERRQMLDDIARLTRETRQETGRASLDPRVMAAMAKVPRHRFVARGHEREAYQNRPLAIAAGQTISQPFIVALMTDLLEVRPVDRVLEIGTGSGYQAAVLAELAGTVHTVEIVESLGREAAARLAGLGYRNVAVKIGDGHRGWAEQAPFDSIVVTAAAREIPQPLLDQLKPGGRLVIPVGAPGGIQTLYLVEKGTGGGIVQRAVLAVRFVPMTGKDGR